MQSKAAYLTMDLLMALTVTSIVLAAGIGYFSIEREIDLRSERIAEAIAASRALRHLEWPEEDFAKVLIWDNASGDFVELMSLPAVEGIEPGSQLVIKVQRTNGRREVAIRRDGEWQAWFSGEQLCEK